MISGLPPREGPPRMRDKARSFTTLAEIRAQREAAASKSFSAHKRERAHTSKAPRVSTRTSPAPREKTTSRKKAHSKVREKAQQELHLHATTPAEVRRLSRIEASAAGRLRRWVRSATVSRAAGWEQQKAVRA